MFAWDDIAVFLAVYRERTTSRSAEILGCSQPTVTRRIAALEHALDLQLFARSPTGLTPTPAADALYPRAQEVERFICGFTSEVAALAGTGQNEIRLTFLDHFERLLVPVLRGFRERWPMVHTQLLATDRVYDFSRGEADIGIRGRSKPESDDIVARELPPTGWTVFASSHSEEGNRPTSPEEVSEYPIALLESSAGRLPVYKWLERQARTGTTTIRCSNYSALKSAIASGAAISVLPFTVGHREPDLVPCFPPMQEFDVTIYLIARRAILRRPPARDLFDSIAAYFDAHPELLTGPRA
jgi:DNA-binding transcriptional LysR family regulator